MKSVLIHGVLAIAGLLSAYKTWTHGTEREKKADEIVLLACDPSELTSVTLNGKQKTISLETRRTDGKSWSWIKVTPNNSAKDKPAGHPAVPPSGNPEQFAGNDAAKEYINSVAPFRALRSLGHLDAKKSKEFGLEKAETKLTVQCGQSKKELLVGESTFGSGDMYAKDSKTNTVYLIASTIVRDMESANFKFMQRSVYTFELKNIERVHIQTPSAKAELIHRNYKDEKTAEWVNASEPTKHNELYGNWLDKIGQLRVQEYLLPGKEPGSELKVKATGSSPIVTLEYASDGLPAGKLELVRVDATPAEYYVRTDVTHGWVKVVQSVAQQVEQDLANVLSKKAKAAPAKEKSK